MSRKGSQLNQKLKTRSAAPNKAYKSFGATWGLQEPPVRLCERGPRAAGICPATAALSEAIRWTSTAVQRGGLWGGCGGESARCRRGDGSVRCGAWSDMLPPPGRRGRGRVPGPQRRRGDHHGFALMHRIGLLWLRPRRAWQPFGEPKLIIRDRSCDRLQGRQNAPQLPGRFAAHDHSTFKRAIQG